MKHGARDTGAAPRIGLLALAGSGCATTYASYRLATPDELRDVKATSIGEASISVSILTDEQARRHFVVDLARHDAQALWISVRNGSDRRLWFIRNMLDPDFYFADEVALLVQGDAYPLDSGKGDPVAVAGRSMATPPRELRFDFALPLPDGDSDYERLDTARLYPGESLPDLTADELRSTLEQLPCCAMNADGQDEGDPLNVVIVGEAAKRNVCPIE